jgi:hypothetical protein
MLYLALAGITHQMRSMWYYGFITFFIKKNYPSTMNRNGRISKLELYHTTQQLSQHDCPIKIFSTSVSVCIWNKLHAGFYLKDVANMLLLKSFEQSVVCMGHWWFIEFIFSDQNYVCFKLNCRELREELHKPPLKMNVFLRVGSFGVM